MVRFSAEDHRYMADALALAALNLGRTGTNPSVGCVLVRDGVIVGQGVTAAGGRPHAEREALKMAEKAARGATAYVTLEPCSHFGRTPPCADALIDAGVARVIAAMVDPNPLVAGQGLKRLAEAGVFVACGLMQTAARRAHAGHINRVLKQRPELFLKMSVSADGFIGLAGQGQVPISGSQAKAYAHELRASSDGIMIGIGTALADDPELTCRLPGSEHHSPARIVLDRSCRLALTSKLVAGAEEVRVIDIVGPQFDFAHADTLRARGVEILQAPLGDDGQLDLNAVANLLCNAGFNRIMVEGGAQIARALLGADLLDHIHLVQSQKILGAGGVPALGDWPISVLTHDPYQILTEKSLGVDHLTIAWAKDLFACSPE